MPADPTPQTVVWYGLDTVLLPLLRGTVERYPADGSATAARAFCRPVLASVAIGSSSGRPGTLTRGFHRLALSGPCS